MTVGNQRRAGLFVGRSTKDLEYVVEAFPTEDEKVFAKYSIEQPGGPALNAAITYQFLGGDSFIISEFGSPKDRGLFKRWISDGFSLYTEDLSCDPNAGVPQSIILVNQQNGSRTIINQEIRKQETQTNQIPSSFLEKDFEFILIDGYCLSDMYDMVRSLRNKGCPVIFDAGSVKPDTDKVLSLVDVLVCSERFLIERGGIENMSNEMHEKGIRNVAATRGSRTILTSVDGEFSQIKVPRVLSLDTLGAGDVFHGAFCYYYAEGSSFLTALKKASKIAAKSCQHFGTHTWHEFYER